MNMNRIEKQFAALKNAQKKALITYITAGHPTIDHTEELIYAQIRGGADIIEIGIPFSDPLADGPVIQKAAQRALDGGVTINKVFECIEKARKNTEIPLVFLVYYNTVLAYGVEAFVKKCSQIGIDGLIIPDLPLEEQSEILPYINETDMALIPLVAPTSKDRMKKITENGRGFVYCVSSLGVTGMGGNFYREVEAFLSEVRTQTELPLAVGFGISNKEDIKRFQPYVDAVIVGSAIVKHVEESDGNAVAVETFIKGLQVERKTNPYGYGFI